MLGKSAFDEFTPSHNLRTLIYSSQQRRSIDSGDRRKGKQKNQSNRRASGEDSERPSVVNEQRQTGQVWSIKDEDPSPNNLTEQHATENSTVSGDWENVENRNNAISDQRQGETLSNVHDNTVEQTQQKNTDSGPSDLVPQSREIDIPKSPRTPTEEQPFANPMDRLRKRTETEIKESFSTSPPASSNLSSPSTMCFYGFPHRRTVVVDGRRRGENKWCRSYAEPRVHASEPLWVPTFQNRDDIMSQFAPYDEHLNNDGSEDWNVWEVLRLRSGYPSARSWFDSALVTRQKQKKKRGEMERWKNFIEAH